MTKSKQNRPGPPLSPGFKRQKQGKFAEAIPLADQYLLPTYKRPPILFTHGRGAYVFDSTGKKYLDFLGGIAVNALGHAHPRIVRTIRREAGRAVHFSNLFHNKFQGPLAKK